VTTIIQRHARDLHAGDVITHDPDHGDRPVRYEVERPPVIVGGGTYAVWSYIDLETGKQGTQYFKVLTELRVEPAGGAA
jgi:hypothetical protein